MDTMNWNYLTPDFIQGVKSLSLLAQFPELEGAQLTFTGRIEEFAETYGGEPVSMEIGSRHCIVNRDTATTSSIRPTSSRCRAECAGMRSHARWRADDEHASLIVLYKTKSQWIAEYRNFWHSAPLLWDYLRERYLPSEEPIAMFGGQAESGSSYVTAAFRSIYAWSSLSLLTEQSADRKTPSGSLKLALASAHFCRVPTTGRPSPSTCPKSNRTNVSLAKPFNALQSQMRGRIGRRANQPGTSSNTSGMLLS
jgi:hypothetical protein